MAKPTHKVRKGDTKQEAAILAYAAEHGVGAAAEKFSVSRRSIQRMRGRAESGEAPKVAELVEEARERAIKRHEDLLANTLEQGLKQLQKRYETIESKDLIKALEMLGEMQVKRDYLKDDVEEPTRRDSAAAGAATAQGVAPGGADRAPGAAHGAPGGRGASPAGAVH